MTAAAPSNSIITARFWRTKEDGYTRIHIKSAAVAEVARAAASPVGRTLDISLVDWQVSVDGGTTWRGVYTAYQAPWDTIVQLGFAAGPAEYPIAVRDSARSAITCHAICAVAVGTDHGVHFRTRRPVAPSTLKEAALGLQTGIDNLLRSSRAIDITVSGVVKATVVPGGS